MKLSYLGIIAIFLTFAGCKKESADIVDNQQSVEASAEKFNIIEGGSPTAKLFYNNTTGKYKLILQPGEDGDDLWYKYWIGHPEYADTNDLDVHLIKGLTWNVKGTKLITRSVIKFDSLMKIPATAQIYSATLFLYGPSPNSPDVNTHLPMGNSSYPGSNYQENSSYLQRITSAWNTNTICWNNQPATTTADQSILTASDKQWMYNTSVDVTNLVKPMVSSPANNYGFMFKLTNENVFRSLGFFSSEYNVSTKRPKLVVVFK